MRKARAAWRLGWVTAGLCGLLAQGCWAQGDRLNPPARLKEDFGPLPPAVREGTSLAPVVRRAAPSVVSVVTTKYVRTPDMRGGLWRFFQEEPRDPRQAPPPRAVPVEGVGSGVIVTQDGYVLTNNHVVEDVDQIQVVLSDGQTELDARVVGRDALTDIAVLKVEAGDLPAVTIADSDLLEVGDLVLAIGNPFGVGQTVTRGIVGATRRSGFYLFQYEDFIQTDASINPGNSGGALVDAEGRLVGVNTFIMSRTGGSAGVGFAVPANLARYVLERIVADGEVRRGYLGVELEERVTSELAREFDLPGLDGALVTRVLRTGPAGRSGLREGDFIVEFNGVPVRDRRGLQFEVAKTPPGTDATLRVIRDGAGREVKVTLGRLDLESFARGRGAPEPEPEPEVQPIDGVELADLTAELRRQFNLPADVDGRVLVTRVDPDSPAFRAGLREGSVLLEVSRRSVSSLEDVIEAVGMSSRGRLLLRVRDTSGKVAYLVVVTQG
jgi:serine protease Do